MQQYNILVGCDQKYYDNWAIELFKSVNYHNPWINLHCHIVNPSDNFFKLDCVDYTFETKDFINSEVELAYLQMARFFAVANKFQNNELVVTLDADSICTKSFTPEEFSTLFEKQYVLRHHKDDRWMAGFVTFGPTDFRNKYAEKLAEVPVDKIKNGRDQAVMKLLADDYNFVELDRPTWMSVGKHKYESAFLTLKGSQKYREKYLNVYRTFKK